MKHVRLADWNEKIDPVQLLKLSEDHSILRPCLWVQTFTGQFRLEGRKRAFVESYFTSYHRFGAEPPPGGRPHEDRIMGGRYVDLFERRDGVWRIARRRGVNEWIRYEAADDRGFFDRPDRERGRRDRSDPVYRRD
jgi:hypothetical protein